MEMEERKRRENTEKTGKERITKGWREGSK